MGPLGVVAPCGPATYFLCFFLHSARYILIASFIALDIGTPGFSFIARNPASNPLSIHTATFSLFLVRVVFSGTPEVYQGMYGSAHAILPHGVDTVCYWMLLSELPANY
jgi:hypothetical protein